MSSPSDSAGCHNPRHANCTDCTATSPVLAFDGAARRGPMCCIHLCTGDLRSTGRLRSRPDARSAVQSMADTPRPGFVRNSHALQDVPRCTTPPRRNSGGCTAASPNLRTADTNGANRCTGTSPIPPPDITEGRRRPAPGRRPVFVVPRHSGRPGPAGHPRTQARPQPIKGTRDTSASAPSPDFSCNLTNDWIWAAR